MAAMLLEPLSTLHVLLLSHSSPPPSLSMSSSSGVSSLLSSSGDPITYHLRVKCTSPTHHDIDWDVHKRFSEFYSLREAVIKSLTPLVPPSEQQQHQQSASFGLPPFPPKTFGSNKTHETLTLRSDLLETYVQTLVEITLANLRTCALNAEAKEAWSCVWDVLADFLGCDEDVKNSCDPQSREDGPVITIAEEESKLNKFNIFATIFIIASSMTAMSTLISENLDFVSAVILGGFGGVGLSVAIL